MITWSDFVLHKKQNKEAEEKINLMPSFVVDIHKSPPVI